jgi:hypothetical protein
VFQEKTTMYLFPPSVTSSAQGGHHLSSLPCLRIPARCLVQPGVDHHLVFAIDRVRCTSRMVRQEAVQTRLLLVPTAFEVMTGPCEWPRFHHLHPRQPSPRGRLPKARRPWTLPCQSTCCLCTKSRQPTLRRQGVKSCNWRPSTLMHPSGTSRCRASWSSSSTDDRYQ